jgi:hypothetical protein
VGKHRKKNGKVGQKIYKGENYERSLEITKTQAKRKQKMGNSP